MSDTNDKKLIDPIIFENNKKNTEEVINPIVFDVPTKSFEDKIYLVLSVEDSNDCMFDGQFKICNGRTECYRYIQSLIETFGENYDVHESKVITETKQTETNTGNTKYYMIDLYDSVSVYAFCKSVEGYYNDFNFNIDDYFSPPDNSIGDHLKRVDRDAKLYSLSIEDQIISQVAEETLKERARLGIGYHQFFDR